ncbi:MAG: peptidase, partial [Flavobacteriaceae bacterium]|nr:peptidase [Flavobacteriaceae bacterium]
TLGFAHNFAASADGRMSVMDYPHPTLEETNGTISLENAYATGIGEWDKVTVAYSYSAIPPETDASNFLKGILREAQQRGLHYISDSDARAAGGAHATAHLWDNGENAATELNRVLELRASAIQNFSQDNIRNDEPYTVLEDVFVPLYFYHRYQMEAASKMIGGLNYTYAVKGDDQLIVETLDRTTQIMALEALLKTMDASSLAIPKDKLKLFPPRAYNYNRSRESFKSHNGVAFDALAAAETAADLTLSFLLHPQRANRLVHQKALDSDNLGLAEVLDQLYEQSFSSSSDRKDSYHQEIDQVVQYRIIQHLFNLATHKNTIPQTKALAYQTLQKIHDQAANSSGANAAYIIYQIENFKRKPEDFKVMPSLKIPDGSPIGSTNCYTHE